MLSLRLLSSLRSIRPYLKQSSLQIHTSVISLNSKDSSQSSSSSSDSSDSDSDKENNKINKHDEKTASLKGTDETVPTSDVNERLNNLLNKINEASEKRKLTQANEKADTVIAGFKSSIPKDNKKTLKTKAANGNEKSINVAIKPKKIRFKQLSKQEKLEQKPHEHQIQQAAKKVAESLGGDTQKIELELLTKALNLNQESPGTGLTSTEEETPKDLSGLLSKMKVNTTRSDREAKKRGREGQFNQSSIAKSVLYKKSVTMPKSYTDPRTAELNALVQGMGILKVISKESKDDLQLPTWNTMEKREMRLLEFTVPQNAFQELIQWTNEGKIWHFPIDNEQGLEDENNVHFSEHVFMDRHLKDWCPKRGPIRHYMELVCTGLSKNPYMTVEEKIGHITWYKNYFEDKKDLLHELGVLDDKASTGKKEIEA